MSERTMILLILPPALLLSICMGAVVGRSKGRAEMKRWQDSWYAGEKKFDEAECAKQRINDFLLGERAIVAPAPPKKAKPAKAEAQPVGDSQLLLNCAPNFDCNKHSDIDPQGAVCVAGSSDGHPIEIPCPQITRPQNCAIYDGQPFPCTIPVQLDSLPAAKP